MCGKPQRDVSSSLRTGVKLALHIRMDQKSWIVYLHSIWLPQGSKSTRNCCRHLQMYTLSECACVYKPKNWNEGIGFFLTTVWMLCDSYCTSGIRAIIWCNLCTLSLLTVWPCDNLKTRKVTHPCLNCMSGLATNKSRGRGTITHLHMWWQDGCHNRFLI